MYSMLNQKKKKELLLFLIIVSGKSKQILNKHTGILQCKIKLNNKFSSTIERSSHSHPWQQKLSHPLQNINIEFVVFFLSF